MQFPLLFEGTLYYFVHLSFIYLNEMWLKCFESLYRAVSISVPFWSENLVGKVILGKKLCAIIESRYSLILGLVVVFNRSIY